MQQTGAPPVATPVMETETPGIDDRDDVPLIEAAQHDPAAITPLYRRYVASVYGYLYSHVGNVQDAEDLNPELITRHWNLVAAQFV